MVDPIDYCLSYSSSVSRNLNLAEIYQQILSREEGKIAHGGAVGVITRCAEPAPHTYIVEEPTSAGRIWWGSRYRPIDPVKFDSVLSSVEVHLVTRQIFVRDCYAGTDLLFRLPIRVITQTAWHDLFVRNLFTAHSNGQQPQFTIVHLPSFVAADYDDEPCIMIDWSRRIAVIAGTDSPAAIQRCVTTLVNYLFPQREILPIFGSVTASRSNGETALFVGADAYLDRVADSSRVWVGNDLHAWSHNGIFRIADGRYLDVASLQKIEGSALYGTLHRFGALVENLPMSIESREFQLNYSNGSMYGRAALPIELLADVQASGYAPHPKNVFIFVADEFGVLPPISKLKPEQATFYFLSGPQNRSEPCFAPRGTPLRLNVYAGLLRQRLQKVKPQCWLINVGHIGGSSGYRRSIPSGTTRQATESAIEGTLKGVPVRLDRFLGLEVPTECPGLMPDQLDPAAYWLDPEAYAIRAEALAEYLQRQFEQFNDIEQSVRTAGPWLPR